jgi:hypothetical protein
MNLQKLAGVGLTACVLLLAGGGAGPSDASSKPGEKRSGIDAKAGEALRKMSDFLGSAGAFTFEATNMVDQVLDNGQKIQVSDRLAFSMQRPGRLAARIAGDTRDERVWYDGGLLTLYDRRGGTYGKLQVPATIEPMLDHVATKYGIVMPLSELFFTDSYKAMTEDVWSGVYLGLHQVQGVPCHHLAFRQTAVDWQIWIEDGASPWPRKVIITYREMPGQPQYIALLDRWERAPRLADEIFKPQIPSGVKEVDIQSVLQSRSREAGGGARKAEQ